MRHEAFADLRQQGVDGKGRRGHRARIRATRIRTWRGEAPNPHPALRASLSRKQERGCKRASTDSVHEQASADPEDRQPHATAEPARAGRSEEHTSELQSLMRISYAGFCLTKKHQLTFTIS